MFEKRKLLIKAAYEKAKRELKKEKDSVSTILSFVSAELEEKFGFSKDERSFVRYYDRLVNKNKDYDIDDITLDQLSWYVGYKNFEDFCKKYVVIKDNGETKIELKIDNDEDSLSEKLSKIIINITNAPIFHVPQLAKNGMGVGMLVLILIVGFAYGNGGIPIMKKENYMYWKDDKYVGTDSSYINPGIDVIAMDKSLLLHLKKINRPDTLTIENSKGKVWYDKSDNQVEFFTSPGIHPENGKALKDVSETIINNHAGLENE